MKRAAELRGSDSNAVHIEIAALYRMAHRYDEALAEYRRLIAIAPTFGSVRYGYARTLFDTGLVDQALDEMELTIEYDPPAHALLVSTKAGMLLERGDGDKAARVLHESPDAQVEAILPLREMDARLADYLDLEPLIATCSRQIEREPEDAQALCRLGALLEASGRFGEALVAYRVGHALGTRQQGWSHPSASWLAEAERLAALEPRVSSPSRRREARDAEEACSFAIVAAREERWSLASDEFALAFDRDPSRADIGLARLEAACAAVQCAQVASRASDPGEAARARDWRARALSLMQREIEARRKQVDAAESLRVVLMTVAAWRAARELASVREVAGSSELTDAERVEWQAAWSDLSALADRARLAWAKSKR